MEELAKSLRAMHELALALAPLRDPGEVASLVAYHIRELLRVDALAIFAWDDAARGLVSMYSTPAGDAVGAVASTTGVVGRAFDERRPIVVNEPPSPSDTLVWDSALALYAVAAVPLIIASDAVGVVSAGRIEASPFTEAQVELLAMLGTYAVAPTLYGARLRSRINELELRIRMLEARPHTDQLRLRLNAGRLLAQEEELPRTAIPQLTPRERDLLPLLAQGRTNGEIGAALQLSPGTARNLVARLQMKLGARDRTHSVVIALAQGLVQL